MKAFSGDCKECKEFIDYLEGFLNTLKQHNMDENIYKDYHKRFKIIIVHLNKKHNLVSEGFYAGLYMSIGMSVGLLIGSAKDATLKKKGLTI
ncbi:hypothetical protein [Alkaliphilus serpentinus]|uniref:Uncharacterized protein n=1 Tax=Alkaliphilus serpentinus TaxID=1482731 RepID=A0A833HR29_9FIRM|nr:hypothetical protein [Alkaliphilus serpentinus]KAB3532820.1 hypothetical protein F8153_01780 [Alkaliphilus serpentinus]